MSNFLWSHEQQHSRLPYLSPCPRVCSNSCHDGWHHWLDGHEFEQASGVGDGQGILACYCPWGCKESDMTEQLNWIELNMSIELVMPCNPLILCLPLLLLTSIFPSFRVFFSESGVRITWPRAWSFSFSISPSNEYSELISFRIDGFDLLAGQGTLKNLLQHHSLRALVLWCSAFFIVQLTCLYMTTGKTKKNLQSVCFQKLFTQWTLED